MSRVTEFKLRAVVASTGQVIEGFHQVMGYDEMVKSGMSDIEIKEQIKDEWLASQVVVEEVKRV
jgi:hypothetical protein